MHIVNRSRHRMENRRRFALPLFVLAVASLSFALGVAVGRGARSKPAPLPPAIVPAESSAKPVTKELTFYDTLPRGEQVPLGSGINLPRESSLPEERSHAEVTVAPVATAEGERAPAAVARHSAVASEVAAQASAAAPPPSAPAEKGRWLVQVASFKTAEDARKMRERLGGKGFQATVREADLAEKGKWYRVVLGPYRSDAEASRDAGRLQQEGLTGLVRKD